MEPTYRLLIVDDEMLQMKALCATLEDAGYQTHGFTSPYLALAALSEQHFDLVLSDLMMPGMDGLELLRSALEIDADLVVILMTGHGTVGTAVEAMKAGALDYISKPFKLSSILPVLDRALTVRQLRLEKATLVKRLAVRTAELEAANHELEAFSYSVSHDLSAPLRRINGFVSLLLAKFSSELPEDAQRYLEIIVNNSNQMEILIRELLRFSRLSRQPLSKQRVDMTQMVKEIIEELGKENFERKIEIKVEKLPPCLGDASLLKQVLLNLLSNAFKFTRNKEVAKIEIGFLKENDEASYFVRDNGAGFDMQYVDKLFGVFQRLHHADEFEGTGIGLSLVQRIIHRHGGQIRVQAAEGDGATFYFTLPMPAPPEIP